MATKTVLTKTAMAQALSRLLVVWPHRAPTTQDAAALLTVYGQALTDLQPEQVARAVDKAIASCKHFPTPAELRALTEPVVDEMRARYSLCLYADVPMRPLLARPASERTETTDQRAARLAEMRDQTLARIRSADTRFYRQRPQRERTGGPAPSPEAEAILDSLRGRASHAGL